jgi:hypothetical protein
MKKDKSSPTLFIKFNGTGVEVEVGKVVEIKLEKTDKQFFYVEKMPNGKWRMSYTDGIIEDIRDLQSLEIVRQRNSGQMIYTECNPLVYTPHFVNFDGGAYKSQGGTVWRTFDRVKKHHEKFNYPFVIYGVMADWSNDTVVVDGESYRRLKNPGKLVMVNQETGEAE